MIRPYRTGTPPVARCVPATAGIRQPPTRPSLGRNLSRDEARQIAVNAIGFFSILAGWARDELPAHANVIRCDASSQHGGDPSDP